MSYALITGASKGIGKNIAEILAAKNYSLLLVARSEKLLLETAEELKNKYSIKVHILALDLATHQAANQVFNWIQEINIPVSVLINNAGYGLWGNFQDLSLESQNNMVQLNVGTLVNLTHLMIPILKKEPESYILNVGSLAGFQAVPTLSLYAASKAFVNVFTRGLAYELRTTSISVTLLAPGGVKTEFVERSGMMHMKETADKMSMTPEEVAKIGIQAMFNRKKEVIPGWGNRMSTLMVRLLPKSLIENVAGSLYKKKA
ncbi:MAG: SDR family NAD(P)-dependent oxidoreductase [Chitinophagaceae bacterium]